MTSKIPVKPFQPLPPLVRMERIRDDPLKTQTTSPNHHHHNNNSWIVDSPTNRSVALLVTNSSGMSNDATITTTPNDSNDLWNPLMMMIDDDDDDDVNVHDMGEQFCNNHLNPVTTTTNQAKRVSLDVSDACLMDVDDNHVQQQHQHALPPIIASDDDHEFEFMEGLEHDPLLALSVICDGDIIGTGSGRISDGIVIPESVPQRLPSLRHLLKSRNDDDIDCDIENDPWTEAATEAAFQITSTGEDDYHSDLMVFEIDQSFLKESGHTTTVGTESTVSSHSSVSPDLLSVLTGDNENHTTKATLNIRNPATTAVPTFFTSAQFQDRCQLLSESMRASQLSRQCLSLRENIKLRDNLSKVLKDIERSTAKVQRHCLSRQIHRPLQQLSTTLAETDTDNGIEGNVVSVPSTAFVKSAISEGLSAVDCDLDRSNNDCSTLLQPAIIPVVAPCSNVTTTFATPTAPIDASLSSETTATDRIDHDQSVPSIE